MEQVTDNVTLLDLGEDKPDARAETCESKNEEVTGSHVDASVDICGAIEVDVTKHDARTEQTTAGEGITESGDDHGAASTDARVLGCLGATNTGRTVTDLPTVSQSQDVYNMEHKYRGHALVINNEKFSPKLKEQGLGNRDGSSIDERVMNRRLNDLGFTVTGYHDLKASQLKSVCSKMATKDHSECDCFVCVILSHGEEGVVYGVDKTVEIKELTSYFKGDRCPSLVGKPKIFIIQACRGYQTDPGVTINVIDAKGRASGENDQTGVEPAVVKLPIEADFLFAYSTIPGYYSWRNGMNGSWFIQALAEALKDFGRTVEIRKLLTVVNKKVAQNFQSFNPDKKDFHRMKQIPCITSMLTKDLYFSTTKKKKVLQY